MNFETVPSRVSELVRLTELHQGLVTTNAEQANLIMREIDKIRNAITAMPIDTWLGPIEKLADHPSLAVRITASIMVHRCCDLVLNRKLARKRLEELAKEEGIAALRAVYYLSEHAKP